MNRIITVSLFLLNSFPSAVWADFGNNLRWSIDMSARLNVNESSGVTSRNYFIGLDTHKIFSSSNKDIGYSVVQLYYTKLSNQTPFPFMFRTSDDKQVIVREAHYNFLNHHNRLLPNIRVGHFTLPFGLEDSQDTNGRLLDYGHGKNLGTKLDWGLMANKVHKNFEYKLAYSLGGKDDPKSINGSYAVTARVSTLSHLDLTFGFSGYKAKLDNTARERVAFDMKYHFFQWTIKNEVAYGTINDDDNYYWLFELNRLSVNEHWKLYLQYVHDDGQQIKQSDRKVVLGARHTPDNHWDFSMQFKHQTQHPEDKNELELFQVQIRYRF